MDAFVPIDVFSALDTDRLVTALQYMPVGVTIIDRDLTVRFWNPAFCQLQAFPADLMHPNVGMAELFRYIARRGDYGPGDIEEQVAARIALSLKFEPHHFIRTRADGLILDITGRPIYDEAGHVTGFVSIYQDVTVEKRYEQQLEGKNKELLDAFEDLKLAQIGYMEMEKDRRKYYELAVRDPLTELFTRYYMEDAANRLIELHERSESARVGVLVFDIDHFKQINDSHGHLGGDAVLKAVGRLLLEQTRRVDVPVRLGGDEFIVFLAGIGDGEASAFAERLRQALTQLRFDHERAGLAVTISIGVTEHRIGESLVTLIARADAALYQAKRAGRNRILLAQ